MVWDTSSFIVEEAVTNEFFIAIRGKWCGSGHESIVVNVYGPHNDEKKKKDVECLRGHYLKDRVRLGVVPIDRRESDHCPIMLRDRVIDFEPKPFKLFDEWFNKEGVDKVIMEAWGKPVSSSRKDCVFRDRLKNVKNDLKIWSKREFGNLEDEIIELKKSVAMLEDLAESGKIRDEDHARWLENRIRWVEKEKTKTGMLKQKARIRWILDGDENSKYFHSAIRRKLNKCNIQGLCINGSWCDEPPLIKHTVLEHFKSIFGRKNVPRPSLVGEVGLRRNGFGRPGSLTPSNSVQPVYRSSSTYTQMGSAGLLNLNSSGLATGIGQGNFVEEVGVSCDAGRKGYDLNRLCETELMALEERFSELEIWEAVKGCGSSKAPGPDGFIMGFYKKFWYVIKEELIEAINLFWDTGEISKGCNASFITLVPKKQDPLGLSDYRPISLIGSYYKVIAKILSNRLKKVEPNLVGT
ncbi:uncharacterized protein [Rutidosis leptorrhynchoides]|uniref:uncharacterized protein n=1 Tax=Rutidosis leptorrhynchoides TaxID=125765 RepID=UPI003A98D680